MVTKWGMSNEVGMIYYDDDDYYKYSKNSLDIVDQEVKSIIDRCLDMTRNIIVENIDYLHKIANALIVHETLSGQEIDSILKDENIERVATTKKVADSSLDISIDSKEE